MKSRANWAEIWIRGCAAILFLTSLLKLASVISHPHILMAPDSLLRIRLVWLMLIEAVVEVAVAAFLVSRADWRLRLLAVFWLGAVFCGYHVSMAILQPHAYCPCLGTLYGKLGVSAAAADTVAKLLSAWFLLSPIAIGAWRWAALQRARVPVAPAPRA